MHTIRLAVKAIKANISCKNINCNHPYEYIALPNNKVFTHIQPCAIELKPFAMMDKYQLMKAALKPIIHATILCYTILQNYSRCRSITEAREIAIEYKNFISSLPISTKAKLFFIHDLEDDWLCQDWILSFIDGEYLPNQEDGPYTKL
ncbi:gephyrin: PROVISIONAL [Gigaspora margarita]|uniref:Gephyrin: PROVISIONAL n=1 Tax=Gigaspora margarita TaxID=4874 RepID=A0A8H4ARF9_GIGMA|nr:gephyrin: PROVISIONAL [Gigaspora margarita]